MTARPPASAPASLRARLLRELRTRCVPVSTGDLARLCAADVRYPTQRTLTEMRRLEACGVVRRLKPLWVGGGGRGRPSVRWSLADYGNRRSGA